MKFRKSSLAAIVGCMVFVSPASAYILGVVNICKAHPDGSVHTILVEGTGNFKFYFKNVATQYTFVLADTGLLVSRRFALNPGTYTLKVSQNVANNPPQVTWPDTIVLRPYTLTPGQGTGCVLNVPVTGAGSKAERVLPRTHLPQ